MGPTGDARWISLGLVKYGEVQTARWASVPAARPCGSGKGVVGYAMPYGMWLIQ